MLFEKQFRKFIFKNIYFSVNVKLLFDEEEKWETNHN